MGTSHSGAEFAGKLRAASNNLKTVDRKAVAAGGKIVEKTFLAAAGAKGALGKRGVTVKSNAAESNGHPAQLVKFGPNPGWVAILDRKTKPHLIRPRKFVGTRGKGVRARRAAGLLAAFGVDAHGTGTINIGGVGPRAFARHPGTPGKHFVEPAIAAAGPLAAAEMRKQTIVEFAKAFT